jgi:type II secretory pathway pseudopilin PulG
MQTLHTPSSTERGRRGGRGFSLVELTMAFAIFLIAALAAYALYVAGTRSFKKAENATDMQQTTRSAFDRMVRELRLAGFNHNADGAPARPDEQIEAAYDTAITFRADFDADDATASANPETALAGTFNIVTTGNDEIVTYALGKPTLPSGSALSFVADVVETTRDGDEETVSIPGVIAVQDDPPYTLYRISLRNVAAMGGFDGTFDGLPEFTVEPIADNVRWLQFRYFDVAGNLLNPATFNNASDDVGGSEANKDVRTRIARVEVEMEGMTPNPDPMWVDPGDSDPDTQKHRKFNLEASVTPRNLGRKGVPDLDLQPPSTPTGLSACVGHCGGVLLTWNANPPSELVNEYKIAYGTTTGNLNQFRSTGDTWVYIDGLDPTGTHYFAVAAADAGGNQSPFTAELSAVNTNNTVPGEVPGLGAAASTAQPGIIVTWNPLAANDSTVSGASGSGGCDFQKPVNRDLDGYALFRDSGSDPGTNPGDEYVGPATLGESAIQHLDTSVVACQDYTYDIRALDGCGVTGADQATTVTTAYTTNILPAAPTNVNAAESGTFQNTVVWDDVVQDVNGDAIAVAGYKVYRAEAPAGIPPSDPNLYGFIGSSPTTSYTDAYGSDAAPAPGNIFWYRVTALDACPNESALSSPDGAECAFDGGIDITPAAGTTVYGVVPIEVTPTGADTYVGAVVEIRDSSGATVFGPVTSSTQPYTFSWDTRSLYPDSYIIIAKVVNSVGCAQAAFSRVVTVTTPACCLSQTGQDLASDNRANSNIVVRLLANRCENDLNATGMVVTFNMSDSRTKLDDIRWNGASIISGNNYESPSTFAISVFIPSVFNGGTDQEVTFDFDRPLAVGDGVSFDLTYSGAVVGEQTCTFNAVISSSTSVTTSPVN